MGAETKIQWTDFTFNPWIGCTKVSPGCTNCYAEARDIRFHDGAHWGKGAPRSRTTASNWRLPLAWNREAAGAGVRKRVFCASLADVFDAEVPEVWRMDLWRLIDECPNLDWQLLTKRPENVKHMLPWSGTNPTPWPNVWVGTTVEDQERADLRIPQLLQVPAAKRFLSVEPLLSRVNLDYYLGELPEDEDGAPYPGKIDWVIVGGESGHGARPFHLDWALTIVEQCKAAGTACFVKQLGEVPVMDEAEWRAGPKTPLLSAANDKRAPAGTVPLKLFNHKGGDMGEWPVELRVREFPR